ncbi:MAG: Lrp/AsnC family transcriptional regulator [Burkholderiales bacterium]|nr:Lrp/AsnC family transcriptional regulator [Burkholderiales bacterium]
MPRPQRRSKQNKEKILPAFSPQQIAIINHLQSGIGICERPYLEAAQRLGMSEMDLLELLRSMLGQGILTRVGPLFQIERMGGAFTLAALHAPPERYEEVAALVNAHPQVAHNYEREHALNMWFVLACEKPEQIASMLALIEEQTQCEVKNFPKMREFFVELKLQVEDK